MPVTIREIAEKAGVSRSTVARALKDHPKISTATKQKVHEIAKELGYVPNYIAQSLTSNRTQTIGMVIGHTDPWTWKVIEGIDLAAHEQNYGVFVGTARDDLKREFEIIEAFRRRRVDGIIIMSSHMGGPFSDELREIDIPVVFINEHQTEGAFRFLSIDDYEGVRQALNYLIKIGHRDIIYVGISNRLNSNARRYQAYQETLAAVGLPIHDEMNVLIAGMSDIETGRRAAERVLAIQPTAVLCYNDRVAPGLNVALREKGIAIPEEVSIMGFDDIAEASYAVPSLTTMRQPQMQLGMQSVEMLLDLLNGAEVKNRILPCELVVRDSTQARNT